MTHPLNARAVPAAIAQAQRLLSLLGEHAPVMDKVGAPTQPLIDEGRKLCDALIAADSTQEVARASALPRWLRISTPGRRSFTPASRSSTTPATSSTPTTPLHRAGSICRCSTGAVFPARPRQRPRRRPPYRRSLRRSGIRVTRHAGLSRSQRPPRARRFVWAPARRMTAVPIGWLRRIWIFRQSQPRGDPRGLERSAHPAHPSFALPVLG